MILYIVIAVLVTCSFAGIAFGILKDNKKIWLYSLLCLMIALLMFGGLWISYLK